MEEWRETAASGGEEMRVDGAREDAEVGTDVSAAAAVSVLTSGLSSTHSFSSSFLSGGAPLILPPPKYS
jgi:hypothetical protein